MKIRPCTIRAARIYIAENHRHNAAPNGALFAVGLERDNGELAGVGLCARPVARMLADGFTCEITRLCTDGTPNACSMIYGALCRAAKALGYKRVVTYTLQSEPGSSLRAANFKIAAEVRYKSWNTPSRPREIVEVDLLGERRKYSTEPKIRWERNF